MRGTVTALLAAAQAIQQTGRKPTQVLVAAAAGRSVRTARNHWPTVLAGLKASTPAPEGADYEAEDPRGFAAAMRDYRAAFRDSPETFMMQSKLDLLVPAMRAAVLRGRKLTPRECADALGLEEMPPPDSCI